MHYVRFGKVYVCESHTLPFSNKRTRNKSAREMASHTKLRSAIARVFGERKRLASIECFAHSTVRERKGSNDIRNISIAWSGDRESVCENASGSGQLKDHCAERRGRESERVGLSNPLYCIHHLSVDTHDFLPIKGE